MPPLGYNIISSLGDQKTRKFCHVYLVQQNETNELAVLKHFKKNNTNQHLAERLRKEATFSFDQTGLPKTIQYTEDDLEINLIKSYSEGITLSEYWKKIKKKDRVAIWKNILQHIAQQLNTLKDLRIVHCDIKPSNILIEEKDSDIQVHLLDFGMAIDLNQPEARNTLFALGYSAPELILNELSIVDHTTDLFALGILSWQLFVGHLPLTHPNPSIFTNLQITHPLPNHEKLPKDMYPVLKKMCHKHSFHIPPNKLKKEDILSNLKTANSIRFQSIEEILKTVETIQLHRSFLGIRY